MRAGPPNPGPGRAVVRAGMRAVMLEYEVFVLSFPHATSSSTISCSCPVLSHFFLRFSEGWVELLLLALLFITLSVVIFFLNMNKVAIVI